jgi:hypothetical protein
MVNAIEKLSLRGVPTVARCSRSKLGDSSLRSEQAQQSLKIASLRSLVLRETRPNIKGLENLPQSDVL